MASNITIENRLVGYPELRHIIDLISAQNPLQRKRIMAYLEQQEEDYWIFAETLLNTLAGSFLKLEESKRDAARSYNQMCMDFLREQIRFRKTGIYRLEKQSDAYDGVYSRPDVMRYYMVGLLLSYLFWPNHYAMLQFLRQHLRQIRVNRFLDVAPGHGLFTVQTMQSNPNLKEVTLVDISDVSIGVVQELLSAFKIDLSKVHFIRSDFFKVDLDKEFYDFICMGEVLEHVNDAVGFMRKAWDLLHPNGTLFVTTCANCPSIDHVYHFHNVAEIRALLSGAGFKIVEDLCLPADDVPEEKWEVELTTINYCAILSKA